MKLEDQVCSLELAQKLKSLGVKQESIFCWQKRPYFEIDERGERIAIDKFGLYGPILPFDSRITETVSAFTVAELLEKLPRGFCVGTNFKLDKYECFPVFYAMCDEEEHSIQEKFKKLPDERDDNPANVCASMLIYLIEHKLVTP